MNIEIQGVSDVHTETTRHVETDLGVRELGRHVVSSMQTKGFWLDAAEVFDAWRIVPRALLFSFGGFTIHITMRITEWYFTQPAAARSVQDASMVSVIFTMVVGLFTAALKFYQDSGRRWDK